MSKHTSPSGEQFLLRSKFGGRDRGQRVCLIAAAVEIMAVHYGDLHARDPLTM